MQKSRVYLIDQSMRLSDWGLIESSLLRQPQTWVFLGPPDPCLGGHLTTASASPHHTKFWTYSADLPQHV
jgi:hypothetical protein